MQLPKSLMGQLQNNYQKFSPATKTSHGGPEKKKGKEKTRKDVQKRFLEKTEKEEEDG